MPTLDDLCSKYVRDLNLGFKEDNWGLTAFRDIANKIGCRTGDKSDGRVWIWSKARRISEYDLVLRANVASVLSACQQAWPDPSADLSGISCMETLSHAPLTLPSSRTSQTTFNESSTSPLATWVSDSRCPSTRCYALLRIIQNMFVPSFSNSDDPHLTCRSRNH